MIIVEEATARGKLLSPTNLELKYMIMVSRMKLIVKEGRDCKKDVGS